MADAELLWRWANDRETRQNSFSKAPIPYADHVTWLERRLASDATRIWIFSDAEVPVGQVRFDISDAIAEIGITVAPEQRGRGYAEAMLRQAVHRLREERGERMRPRALVLAHNTASLRLFKACGFEEVASVRRDGEPAIVLELADMVS
ncbi:MAG: GNAT family N-acetyltransferase [Candidatus Rokubacteria bacterium]|nr:GNAT family N-acetyltransferase [Candidatus Rokubacteria bacterium]